jgi:hypothetical protein
VEEVLEMWKGIKEGNIGPKRYYKTENEVRSIFRKHKRNYRKSETIQDNGIVWEWGNEYF